MKVLLLNPDSPVSFWSFRETCGFLGRKALNPPLSLMTVAALLPTEWELRLRDLAARPLDLADMDWADLVMISGMIVQREGVLDSIRQAKERGKTVVVGGPYATSLSQEVLEAGCDFLVRGEGESTVPLLLQAIAGGEKHGVFSSDNRPDMTESPIPRFDLINFDDYIALTVQTSRGCPFDCEFCDIVNLYGRKPRYKNPRQIVKELEAIYRLGWRQEVFIADDNFIGSKAHARATLAELTPWMKAHGEPFTFWTQTSVNLGQDRELIDLMTEANISTVFLGIESPDEAVLELNRKYQNISHPLVQSIRTIGANGLNIVGSFVLGFDNEKPGAGRRICAFVEETGIPIAALHVLQVLPNTALWERLKKEGRLLEDMTSGQTTGSVMNFVPSRPQAEIIAEFLGAWQELYEPSPYLERTYRFFLAMRPTRAATSREKKQSGTGAAPDLAAPHRNHLQNVLYFLRLAWKHGIRSSYRFQYWKQLFGMLWKNPSRFVKYLGVCELGTNMTKLTEVIRTRMTIGETDQSSKKS